MNFAFVSGTHFAIYNGNMSRTSSSSHRFPKRLALLASLALGSALALGAGCTFEPPGSVLGGGGGGGGGGGADGGDEADADIGGDETMTITFTSEPVGGSQYAPANVVATWIEDANGAFVQTINRQSAVRTQHLVAWTQMSGGLAADQDAVTGATRLDHNTPVTATWAIPAALPDGIYTVRVETCDDNSATAEQNTQGTFTFEKNGTASTQTPVGLGYSNVTLDYSGRL